MKRDLYIDCDGVIFDTITNAFIEMEMLGIDTSDELAITNYFQNVNWHELIQKSGQINDSIRKILLLKESNLFNNVAIATHHCSYLEGQVKSMEFQELMPSVQVFNIPKKIPKHYAVNSHGNILVDDSRKKIIDWINDGGYGVLFKQDINSLTYPTVTKPYFTINDLMDLVLINEFLDKYVSTKENVKSR